MKKINSFIVPIVHSGFLGRFLETLYKYTEDNFYVFVIDQCTDDEAYIKYHKDTHLWIKSYRNLGFAKAMNTGIKLAQTPYITLANDDMEFINKRWWQGILDTFEMDHHIIAVNPMSPKEGAFGYGLTAENDATWKPTEGFVRDGESVIPELPDGSGFGYKEEFTEDDYEFLLKRHPRWTENTICDAIAMWCTVFKKTGLEKIGVIDERFYPGNGEDYDMCGRAYSCAWPVPRDECDLEFHYRMVASTKSWVWHHWGKSKEFLNKATPAYSRSNWNRIDLLWPNGFDVWGHGHHENGDKFPFKRDAEVFVDEL